MITNKIIDKIIEQLSVNVEKVVNDSDLNKPLKGSATQYFISFSEDKNAIEDNFTIKAFDIFVVSRVTTEEDMESLYDSIDIVAGELTKMKLNLSEFDIRKINVFYRSAYRVSTDIAYVSSRSKRGRNFLYRIEFFVRIDSTSIDF